MIVGLYDESINSKEIQKGMIESEFFQIFSGIGEIST